MEGDVTDYVVNLWLKTYFTKAWFSLHTASPGRAGDIHTELVGGSYGRVNGAFSLAVPGDVRTVWLMTALSWTGLPSAVLTHVGVWDAQFNGHLLSYGGLPPPYPTVPQGGSFAMDANTYAISVGLAS